MAPVGLSSCRSGQLAVFGWDLVLQLWSLEGSGCFFRGVFGGYASAPCKHVCCAVAELVLCSSISGGTLSDAVLMHFSSISFVPVFLADVSQ